MLKPMTDFARESRSMVEHQLKARGLKDRAILAAMAAVPREQFVETEWRDLAYRDSPLAIGQGQTISQPYIVAFMAWKAELTSSDRVLEIGTGSGYCAAVLSQLVTRVYTIERHRSLLEQARQRFLDLGYSNIESRLGDGCQGWPEAAPFEAILVSAAAEEIPPVLLEQLAVGGRLILPLGPSPGEQRLLRLRKQADGSTSQDDLGPVQFVPLVRSPWGD